MTGAMNLLRALQHGDSAFPSGGFAFSNGMEGAAMLGIALDAGHLGDIVAALMKHRWATAERVALTHAHRAGGDLDRLTAIDAEIEATTLVEGLRLGSRRNGAAMLAAHMRLGTPGAQELRDAARAGRMRGHLAAVQGDLWRAVGIGEADAVALGAYQAANGLVAAAVRLSRIGAVEAQSVLGGVLESLAPLIAMPVAEDQAMTSFAPLIDIAAMRHGRADLKLFAN